jgi:hypothetical protein
MIQRKLVQVADAVERLEGMRLVNIEPHGVARDALLANVSLSDRSIDLRGLSETMFCRYGIVVHFRPIATLP